jgi:DNA-binding NarL/FixJ family response regulator
VLRLVAVGYTNQAIPLGLVIEVGTAKRHVHNILGKLDVQSRTQAIVRARARPPLASRPPPHSVGLNHATHPQIDL